MARAAGVLGDERASAAMVFTVAAPIVIAAAALSVETSFNYNRHTHLQAAADAAAFAGALEQRSQTGATNTAASDAATANGWSSANGTITVHAPPTSGAYQSGNAVEVILTENEPRFFTALFNSQPLLVQVRAVALAQKASNACVLALNKTAGKAVEVTGNASLTLSGCDVVSNSNANDGIYVWGSGDMSAACVASAGGIANHGGLSLTACQSALINAPRVADPFAGLPVPTPGSPQTIPKNGGTLSPGWYSSGMDLKGDYTLQPGVYYVSGGDFSPGGNANVTGDGVTIYLADGSHFNTNGNPTIKLTAPKTGTYAGMLMMSDPNSTGGTNKINGNASSLLTGNLYFPMEDVIYQGNFSGAGGCMHLVANTVDWTGSASVAVDCTAQYGMGNIASTQPVRLVE